MPQPPINADMSIPEIVAQYPETKEVFTRYGIQVENYKALEYENLFASSRVHQIDLPEILDALNAIVHVR